MAAISTPIPTTGFTEHLRPFDVRRDLGAVADLVELCFADTLDPDGRNYLARMRSAGEASSFTRLTKGWSGATMYGFVWEEAGQVIGNVSLIPFIVQNRSSYLIANVAVHPSYRRQGIGRRLTEVAIDYCRKRHAPVVWLHVRAENSGAQHLYRSLGFHEQAVRTTWIANPDFSSVEEPPATRFMKLTGRHWPLMKIWLQRIYPPELAWHLPFQLKSLDPGLIGLAARFLYNTYILSWVMEQGGLLKGAAAWQATAGHANSLWLAAPADAEDKVIFNLLQYARRHAPTRRVLALDYPAYLHDQAIRLAGFDVQQTLVWMSLPLNQRL